MSRLLRVREPAKEWAKQTRVGERLFFVLMLALVIWDCATGDWLEGFRVLFIGLLVFVISVQAWMIDDLLSIAREAVELARPKREKCPDYPGPCLCSKKHTRLDG